MWKCCNKSPYTSILEVAKMAKSRILDKFLMKFAFFMNEIWHFCVQSPSEPSRSSLIIIWLSLSSSAASLSLSTKTFLEHIIFITNFGYIFIFSDPQFWAGSACRIFSFYSSPAHSVQSTKSFCICSCFSRFLLLLTYYYLYQYMDSWHGYWICYIWRPECVVVSTVICCFRFYVIPFIWICCCRLCRRVGIITNLWVFVYSKF